MHWRCCLGVLLPRLLRINLRLLIADGVLPRRKIQDVAMETVLIVLLTMAIAMADGIMVTDINMVVSDREMVARTVNVIEIK